MVLPPLWEPSSQLWVLKAMCPWGLRKIQSLSQSYCFTMPSTHERGHFAVLSGHLWNSQGWKVLNELSKGNSLLETHADYIFVPSPFCCLPVCWKNWPQGLYFTSKLFMLGFLRPEFYMCLALITGTKPAQGHFILYPFVSNSWLWKNRFRMPLFL